MTEPKDGDFGVSLSFGDITDSDYRRMTGDRGRLAFGAVWFALGFASGVGAALLVWWLG